MGQAYIGKIVLIAPIENADRIERVEVDCGPGGKWSAVSQLGTFEVGNLAEVYLQDSLLPQDDPRFDFMEPHNHRVRMMRLRGTASEALVMPLQEVTTDLDAGTDVSSILRVKKYFRPLPARISGSIAGHFPSFIPKTDEPNFQKVPLLVAGLQGQRFIATEKADGVSTTAYIDKEGEFRVCSRNYITLRSSKPSTLWAVAEKYGVEDALRSIGGKIAMQWETVGPGIQKNQLGLLVHETRLFDMYDFKQHTYLDPIKMFALAEDHGLKTVRVIDMTSTFNLDGDDLRIYAEGRYPNGRQREGVVFRPFVGQYVNGERLSFKVINLRYKG